ncbi:ABC transporter substrate-binding protein [Ramlibacter terrae]|uniref:ABC transporter substrate-binding protein n=1 Tax=Ramlibacter terrae TaxID=2732511 RepID=A0ABX6P6K9_9BURK|nr:ABC transporter substrate-binding protein [Ramlibacter terrae]
MSVLFAPVYIAEEGGFFKEAGLDVDVGLLGGPAALNALIGGSGDFTTIAGLLGARRTTRPEDAGNRGPAGKRHDRGRAGRSRR